MTKPDSTKTSMFGWKGVMIAVVLVGAFLSLLYLAINHEEDYMPSQQMKKQNMSHKHMQMSDASSANMPSKEMPEMTEQEHMQMMHDQHTASSSSAHENMKHN